MSRPVNLIQTLEDPDGTLYIWFQYRNQEIAIVVPAEAIQNRTLMYDLPSDSEALDYIIAEHLDRIGDTSFGEVPPKVAYAQMRGWQARSEHQGQRNIPDRAPPITNELLKRMGRR